MIDWRQIASQSLSERHWKETGKRFAGDPKLSASFLPVARTILGGLINQLQLGGITYGHRIINLPDGTVIRVIHNSGINIVEIDTTVPVKLAYQLSYGGFVFTPQIDYTRGAFRPAYIPADQIKMAIRCNINSPQVKIDITGPVPCYHGNQHVFYKQDVYSWHHSELGDGPGGAYGVGQIWKNGALWRYYNFSSGYLPGIIGLMPLLVDLPDGTKEFRYLLAANTAYSGIEIRIYKDNGTEMIQLDGAISLRDPAIAYNLYSSSTWPVRFNKDGTKAAMIFSYIVYNTVTVQGIDYENSFWEYQIAEATITHTQTGISGSCSFRTGEWRTTNKYIKKTTEHREHSEYVIPSSFFDFPPAPSYPNCPLGNFNVTSSYGGTDLHTWEIVANYTEEYPIALNYIGDILKIVMYKHFHDEGQNREVYGEDAHTFNVRDEYENTPTTDDFGVCTNTVRRLLTTTGHSSDYDRSTRKMLSVFYIDNEEVYRSDRSSSLEVVFNNPSYVYMEQGGREGEPYPIHENPANSTQRIDEDRWEGGGYLNISFIDVRNKVFVAVGASSGTFTKIHVDLTVSSTTSTGPVYTRAGSWTTGAVYEAECIAKIDGGRIATPKETALSVSEEEGSTNVDISAMTMPIHKGSNSQIIDYGHEKSYTTHVVTLQPADPPTWEMGFPFCDFSYARDSRLKYQSPVYAYSIWYGTGDTGFYETRCTFGDIRPYLPSTYPGTIIPDGGTLAGKNITTHPIGMF